MSAIGILCTKRILPKKGYFNNTVKLLKNIRRKLSRKSVYLIDEDDTSSNSRCHSNSPINNYTKRTFTCGELRISNIGQNVTLCGWFEYQRLKKFVVLRDSYGETQAIINEQDIDTQKIIESLPLESIIEINGIVMARPPTMINKKQATGEIEVSVEKFTVLNKVRDKLPFNIREFQKAKEPLRMQYRYLDLRFPQMQRNLRVRSNVLMKMREFLINNNFVDVETPTLFKATPGGAQEFIVPTRTPGHFYSLVQSPQQFKQMLMAGAIDRYFQIARCYRDEGARSDRQPEFTQLDIELSFTTVEGIINMIEELLVYSWPVFLDPIATKFDRISYRNAMELYGSDKPDVRFDFKLKNCTFMFKSSEKFSQDNNFGAYSIIFPREYNNLNKTIKNTLMSIANTYSKVKFVQSKINTVNEWKTKLSKLLTNQLLDKLVEVNKIEDDSVIFLAYGDKKEVLSLLGKIRIEYVDYLESLGLIIRKKGMHFTWIVDFPLFEMNESGALETVHHPFTAPNPENMHLLDSSPLEVKALAYDLVLNGNEVGGGSIRIHDAALQEKILDMLNIEKSSINHMIAMLGSGCPPHGGIALGLDRLLSIYLKTVSIRDVIAFPKTFEGKDPISGAPSRISSKEEQLYHIKCD